MAGYRPIGLSSAAGSTIIAGRATSYADRRRAATERLSKTADIARGLDDALDRPPAEAAAARPPVDPDGTLRAAIRALIPLAYRTEGFDVTVSLGPAHEWAARIRRDADGVTAELVPGAGSRHGAATGAADAPGATGPSEAEIAAELASLLWSGEVGAR